MYSWTLGLPHEVKISEAYQMLKKQGERQWSGRGRAFVLPLLLTGHLKQTFYFLCPDPALAPRAGALPFLVEQRDLLVV